MVICPDCGKEVEKTKFCKNCGAYLENVEEIPRALNNYNEAPVIKEAEEVVEVTPAPAVSGEVVEVTATPAVSQVKDKFQFCPNCGYQLTGGFKFCPNCGEDLNGTAAVSNNVHTVLKEKNVLLAVILSVIMPGLGQIYLGLDRKGSLFLIGYVVSAILILLIIGFVLIAILWIWALVDTIISANAINRGDKVEDKLF